MDSDLVDSYSIILTRSDRDNLETSKLIRPITTNFPEKTIKIISCPQIEAKEIKINYSLFEDANILIITSKIASQILNNNLFWPVEHLLVVGKNSAKPIESNKYIKKVTIFKNVEDLENFLRKSLSAATKIVYFSSNNITKEFGSEVIRQEIYNIKYREELNLDTKEALVAPCSKKLVMVYSLNSAKSFIAGLEKTGIKPEARDIYVIALSHKIVALFKNYSKNLFYCDSASQISMIEFVKEVISGAR